MSNSKLPTKSRRPLIWQLPSILIAISVPCLALSQALNRHCSDGGCVPWGGSDECVLDSECKSAHIEHPLDKFGRPDSSKPSTAAAVASTSPSLTPSRTPTPTIQPTPTSQPSPTLTPTPTLASPSPTPTSTSSPSAVSLLANGSFEQPVVSSADYPSTSSQTLTSWKVIDQPGDDWVMLADNSFGADTRPAAAEGKQVVAFNTWSSSSYPGGARIAQTVTTTPGIVYELSAKIATWPDYQYQEGYRGKIKVYANNPDNTDVLINGAQVVAPLETTRWLTIKCYLKASGARTTIAFEDAIVSTQASIIASAIDDVRLVPGTGTPGVCYDEINAAPQPQPTTTPSVSEPPASSTGLIGKWSFDEGSGTAALDVSGNEYSGSLMAGTARTAGVLGGALSFDGIDDQVNIPNTPDHQLKKGFTIAFWMRKSANPSDWVRLVGKGGPTSRNYGVWIGSGAGSKLLVQFSQSQQLAPSVFGSKPLDIGKWYHIAGTWDGQTGRIYIDGVLDQLGPMVGPPVTSSDPLTFGYAGFHQRFAGQLDEVHLFDRALAGSEIVDLYKKASKISNAKCVLEVKVHETVTSGVWSVKGENAQAIYPDYPESPLTPFVQGSGDIEISVSSSSGVLASYGAPSSRFFHTEDFGVEPPATALVEIPDVSYPVRIPYYPGATSVQVKNSSSGNSLSLTSANLICKRSCFADGQTLNIYTQRCCNGLTPVHRQGAYYCTNCGDSKCASIENNFNCPADCGG